MVTIEYFFSNEDDYEDYPRFQETERVVISAKVHRRMPAQSEFDDRYLPLFIFEWRAWRSSKRGWINVNKKYHAYLADDGEIKHITFKTWKTFIKTLNTELDKTRVENEITEEIVNFSPYENIPSVTLHHTFFSDEALLIEDTIEKIVEEEWSTTEIQEKIINMDNLIWKTLLDIEDTKREIEKIKKHPELVVVPDAVNSLIEIESDVIESDIKEMYDKLYREHGNLKLIRHDYYAILKERQKLSANLHDTIHTILYATSPKYRELCARKKSLEELISAAVKNGDEKLVAEIIKREKRLEELENKLQALTKQHEELTRKGDIERKEIEKRVRAEIEKSIISISDF
ncbi:MAG: hypothetical protein N2V75_00250 [Methanophagales archaeon]|nr:hypothetical protein [Methanophagales archaeon]